MVRVVVQATHRQCHRLFAMVVFVTYLAIVF